MGWKYEISTDLKVASVEEVVPETLHYYRSHLQYFGSLQITTTEEFSHPTYELS